MADWKILNAEVWPHQLRVLVNIRWAMYVKGIKDEKVHVCQKQSIQLVDVIFLLLALSINADKTCVL